MGKSFFNLAISPPNALLAKNKTGDDFYLLLLLLLLKGGQVSLKRSREARVKK